MKKLYQKLLESYILILQIHINTKTMDRVFHQLTEEFYESLFEMTHMIGEKTVDLGDKVEVSTLEFKSTKLPIKELIEMKKFTLEILENLIKEVEKYNKNNITSLGTEDMLGSISNKLETLKGDIQSVMN